MDLKRVMIVSVPVKDQQAAKKFYTEILGFQVATDMPMGENQQWIELALPGGDTHLTLVSWFPQMPPGSLQGMVIETSDVKATYAGLVARGVTASPIETAPWGSYCTFSDPDGNGFVVQQPRGNPA